MNGYLAWDEAAARNVVDALKAKPGALLLVLHEFQETFGDIAPDAELLIADALDIARAEVHGAVTFDADFRVTPPTSVSAWVNPPRTIESISNRFTALGYGPGRYSVAPPAMVDGHGTVWDSTGLDPPIREAVQLLVTQDNQ